MSNVYELLGFGQKQVHSLMQILNFESDTVTVKMKRYHKLYRSRCSGQFSDAVFVSLMAQIGASIKRP